MKILRIISIPLLLLLSVNTYAQKLERCDSNTAYWVIKDGKSYFKVKVPANCATTENEKIIAAGDYVLQARVNPVSKYYVPGKTDNELKILINYVSSEVNYMSQQFGVKLEAQMQKAPLSRDKDVVIWWYKMPEKVGGSVENQVFASIIIDGSIFGLAIPQFKDQSFDKIRNFLMDVISTLEKVETKKDLKNLCAD